MLRNRSTARRGFTLVELLVVVLIIGILMAVAIPFYLGYRNGSGDRVAQSNLTTAMLAAQNIATAENSFVHAAPADLVKVEPNISFKTTAVSGDNANREIAVDVASDGNNKLWVAAAMGRDKRCWYVAINLTSGNLGATGAKPGVSYATEASDTLTQCSAATGALDWKKEWDSV